MDRNLKKMRHEGRELLNENGGKYGLLTQELLELIESSGAPINDYTIETALNAYYIGFASGHRKGTREAAARKAAEKGRKHNEQHNREILHAKGH